MDPRLIQTVTLLNGATASGVGTGSRLAYPSTSFTLQTTYTEGGGGSISALTIDLEGSLDGTTYFQLAQQAFSAAEITAKAQMFHVVDKPVLFLRGNVSTLTKTGTCAITTKCLYLE